MFKVILSQKENVRYIIYMKKSFFVSVLFLLLQSHRLCGQLHPEKRKFRLKKQIQKVKLSAAESKEAELEQQKEELLGEINSLDQSLVKTLAEIEILKGEISDKEDSIERNKRKTCRI